MTKDERALPLGDRIETLARRIRDRTYHDTLPPRGGRRRQRLAPETKLRIVALFKDGLSEREIAGVIDCDPSTVRRVLDLPASSFQ